MSILGIGIGKCSLSFFFILGNVLSRIFRDLLLEKGVYFELLDEHKTIANILMYLGYVIFCLVLLIKSNGNNNKSKANKSKNNLASQELIYNDNNITNDFSYSKMYRIILVSLIFVLHSDLIKLLYSLKISPLDFWTFDLIFSCLFMKRYFIINHYKHQRLSIYLISILCTILLSVGTFFPFKDDEEVYIVEHITENFFSSLPSYLSYLSFCFCFFFLFMLITFMTSFARVRSKKLMDIEYISPFLIIFLTGLIGLFLNIISLIISTFIKCNVNSVNIMDELCKLDKDGERYYDNLFVFFSK